MPFGLPLRQLFRQKQRDPQPPQPPLEKLCHRQPHYQRQSPLFGKLPPELRQHIFELVMNVGDEPVQLGFSIADPGCVFFVPHSTLQESVPKARMRSLLATCMRAYTEAGPLLYGNNTFDFYQPYSVCQITKFSWCLWLRRLDFYWPLAESSVVSPVPDMPKNQAAMHRTWTEVWESITLLKGLRWLKVGLSVNPLKAAVFIDNEGKLMVQVRSALSPDSYGELILSWPREAPLGESAEEILDLWTVKRKLSRYYSHQPNADTVVV